MNERQRLPVSSGLKRLWSEKALVWLYFLYLRVWVHIFESGSLKVMQSVQVWSCANFFLSPQMPPPFGRSSYGGLESIAPPPKKQDMQQKIKKKLYIQSALNLGRPRR